MKKHAASLIPMADVQCYFDDCVQTAPWIVSVGCGTGAVEAQLTASDPELRKRLILVDPAQTSFQKGGSVVLPADFDYVSSLIDARPKVVGECLLLLIWTHPLQHYDYDALLKLEPKSVLVLYERPPDRDSGAACGELMHHFMLNPLEQGYREMSQTMYEKSSIAGWAYPRLAWFAKRGSRVPTHKKSRSVQGGHLYPWD